MVEGEEIVDIERNDVDLTKLFKWSTEIEIQDEKGNSVTSVFMRLVGDSELNQARIFGLRESAKLRRALKTLGTTERDAFVSDLELREPEFIAKTVTILSLNSLSTDARRNVIISLPIDLPSDASSEELEEYQETVDNFPLEYAKKVEEEITKLAAEMEEKLLKLSDDELQDSYEEALINNLCSTRMTNKFLDMCIFLGTFSDIDMKERKFSSLEEYENLATEVKDQLTYAYNTLDMPIEKLKK
ncbi:hypothetical protein LCGC14_0482920 [marine sediment metagenome]|uniref:Uncharacterized protein n=1 Tax=marine sediment metagenome TaxID=412755 RepID=A0A0F9SE80_9ZZZZ|nr:hypothetical protein [bacterium]